MKCLAVFLLFGAAYTSIQEGYEHSAYQYYDQEGGYEPYEDEESQGLSQVLRQLRDSIQYSGAYIEEKLEYVQQYLEDYKQMSGGYGQHVQLQIDQVISLASQLKQQVYRYLEYSKQQYSHQFEYEKFAEYPEDDQYEKQPSYQIGKILRQVTYVLQRTQYSAETKLQRAQQILSQYEHSGKQPSELEQQDIQEVKLEAYFLQQRVYQYLHHPQDHDEDFQQPGQYDHSSGQVARYLNQVQHILHTAQYYSQIQLRRAQYILSQYEQTNYELTQQSRQLVQELKRLSSNLRQQIYADTEYFVQNSEYPHQNYEESYGYQRHSQYGRQSFYYGYFERYQFEEYDRQLTEVLSRVRYVLKSVQYRSQQRLRQAQQLYTEQQQSSVYEDHQEVQRLAQQLRSQAFSVQLHVYQYLQHAQNYRKYESTGYSNIRNQLLRIRKLVEQGVDMKTIEIYVRQNFPSGSEVTESIMENLQQGREQLRNYLDHVIRMGYFDHSSSDYERVKFTFEQRYGLPFSGDYYEFARYLVQTYHRDLSAESTSTTVRHLAQHFLGHVGELSKVILREALEFFRQYRSQVGEYYYQAVEEAVRQQLSS